MAKASSMRKIELHAEDLFGRPLKAMFLPDHGMNLASYTCGDCEVIDGKTAPMFAERFAGLGALIGPHFHRCADKDLGVISNEKAFPHAKRVFEKGVKDPFSHGIARYVPWNVTASENQIRAHLSGEDLYQGMLLKDLEGQNFKMVYDVSLSSRGLKLDLRVSGEKPSVCGLHTYYRLPKKVMNDVFGANLKMEYRDNNGQIQKIPEEWEHRYRDQDGGEKVALSLILDKIDEDIDYSFFPNKDRSALNLATSEYKLSINRLKSTGQSWQLYRPKGASFVCLEPISQETPRAPSDLSSRISVEIRISPSLSKS